MATIIGLKELEQKLKKLDLAVQSKELMKAAKAGGEIIRDAMEQRAPRDTGRLAAGEIVSALPSQSNAYVATVRIGPSRKVFWGLFQEFGTAHMAAQPFVLPAFEATKDEALALASREFKTAVERI